MSRDVIFLPNSADEWLAIACDNSGGIGEKERDVVHVPYEMVIDYGLRVAFMELFAVGAKPNALIVQNFVHDDVWPLIEKGRDKICKELSIEPILLSGSTESNFSLLQSALGFTVIGKVKKDHVKVGMTPKGAAIALIGKPLVGKEVIDNEHEMAPLSLFKTLLHHPGVYEIVPCGSKGIFHECKLLNETFVSHPFIDLQKSAGPATCFVMTYDQTYEQQLQTIAKTHFHKLKQDV